MGATVKRHLKCPFHDDSVASAEFKQVDNGKYYFYCHTCGIADDYWALKARVEGRSVGDVLKETGDNKGGNAVKAVTPGFKTWDALYANWKGYAKPHKIEDVYKYTDPETGEADYVAVRYIAKEGERKRFYQAHRNGSGWKGEAPKGKTPLFNRTRIAEAKNILIVEGEKCVKAFTKLNLEGWAATTNPGGANSVEKADWTPVRDKNCYIWHDNDEAGLKHFETVKSIVSDLGCAVYRVRIEELGLDEKEDIADYIRYNEGLPEDQRAAVSLVLGDSECLSRTSELENLLKDIASHKFKHIPFVQMPVFSSLSKALLPGTVTTIVGEPGVGKSFFVLEQFWVWQLAHEHRVKLLMLEEPQSFHQRRMLAQMAQMADITDTDFIAANSEMVDGKFQQCKDSIEKVSRHLTVTDKQWTLDQVSRWVVEQSEADVDVIMVDPVTAAAGTKDPWLSDQKFMFEVKQAMERTGKRLLLTTHPRIGKSGAPGLSGIAGGSAYPRFSQCVAWLRYFDKDQEGTILVNGYHQKQTYRRSVEIWKSRNGRGQGASIAIDMGYGDLRFREIGIIDKNAETE